MKVWQCTVCNYIHDEEKPPVKCPICGVGADKFVWIDEAATTGKRTKKRPVDSRKVSEEKGVQPPETGLEKIYSLLIRHHAHPICAHNPNGILPVAVLLWVLAWISGADLLSSAAFINMIFVVVALPLVISTGILEWKKKYNGVLTPIFILKIVSASITTVSCIIVTVWYLFDPEILSSPRAWVFIFISLVMLIFAGIAGHIGGKLVFKD